MTQFSPAAFLSRLSPRERMILIVTVIVAGMFIAQRFVLAPVFSKMSDLDSEIAACEANIKKSLAILASEAQMSQEKERYLSAVSDLKPEEEMTVFLKDIENLAKESSVYLVDIKPAGQGKDGEFDQYFLDLNFEAQMDKVLQFFFSMAYSEKLIKITRYQIRPKTEGSSVVACNMSVLKLVIPK